MRWGFQDESHYYYRPITPGQHICRHTLEVAQKEFTQELKVLLCFLLFFFFFYKSYFFPFYCIPKISPFIESTNRSLQSVQALPVPRQGCVSRCSTLGYAVLLLEQGVLCVLPILCAALLFSEAGWDGWTCCVPAVSPRHRAGEGWGRNKGKDWTKKIEKKMYTLEKARGRQKHD